MNYTKNDLVSRIDIDTYQKVKIFNIMDRYGVSSLSDFEWELLEIIWDGTMSEKRVQELEETVDSIETQLYNLQSNIDFKIEESMKDFVEEKIKKLSNDIKKVEEASHAIDSITVQRRKILETQRTVKHSLDRFRSTIKELMKFLEVKKKVKIREEKTTKVPDLITNEFKLVEKELRDTSNRVLR